MRLRRPVEIEFAGNINPNASGNDEKGKLYWLQIRPIVDRKEMLDDSIMHVEDSSLILRSDTALGHGLMDNVRTVVYVKPSTFDRMRNPEVALEVEKAQRPSHGGERAIRPCWSGKVGLVGLLARGAGEMAPDRRGTSHRGDSHAGLPYRTLARHAFLPEPHFVRRRIFHC